MGKSLNDFVQYYIGCRCLNTWFPEDHKEYNAGWKLEGFRPSRPRPYLLENITSDTWTDSIKPILRKIQDIKDEEAISLYRTTTRTPFLSDDTNEYDVTRIKDKGGICSIQVVDLRMNWLYMNINIENDILIYTNEQNKDPQITQRVSNQSRAFHYLLKQGFDLFQLIENDLGVDEKTLTK